MPENASRESLDDHVYNTSLWSYDHQIKNRVQNQVIRVGDLSKPMNRYARLQEDFNPRHIPSITPAPEELQVDPSIETLDQAIIVGIRPRCSPAVDKAANKTHGNASLLKIRQKGASVNSLTEAEALPYDPEAVRVVCPRFKETATFYALDRQNKSTKLCDGVLIDHKEVFFFKEFRNDDTTSLNERKMTWSVKIRAKLGAAKENSVQQEAEEETATEGEAATEEEAQVPELNQPDNATTASIVAEAVSNGYAIRPYRGVRCLLPLTIPPDCATNDSVTTSTSRRCTSTWKGLNVILSIWS